MIDLRINNYNSNKNFQGAFNERFFQTNKPILSYKFLTEPKPQKTKYKVKEGIFERILKSIKNKISNKRRQKQHIEQYNLLELQELSKLKNIFQERLEIYKGLFSEYDIIPDMKDFEEYETQNLKSLQKLYLELNQRIEHQEGINNLKSVFTLGLNYYLQNNPVNTDRDVSQNSNPVNTEKNELNRAILLDISPDYNKSGKHIIKAVNIIEPN